MRRVYDWRMVIRCFHVERRAVVVDGLKWDLIGLDDWMYEAANTRVYVGSFRTRKLAVSTANRLRKALRITDYNKGIRRSFRP